MRPCHPTETLQKRQCTCGLFWLACPCSSDALCPDCKDDLRSTPTTRVYTSHNWAYRQAHREQRAAYNRAYYQAHREQFAAYQRAYYQAHREQAAAYQRRKRAT
jgi:hypothetical protein